MHSLAVVLDTSSGVRWGPRRVCFHCRVHSWAARGAVGWDDVGRTGQGVPVLSLSLLFFFLSCLCWVVIHSCIVSQPTIRCQGQGPSSAPNGTVAQELGGDQGMDVQAITNKLEVHGCGQTETSCQKG